MSAIENFEGLYQRVLYILETVVDDGVSHFAAWRRTYNKFSDSSVGESSEENIESGST